MYKFTKAKAPVIFDIRIIMDFAEISLHHGCN